jgi:4-hydroxythreonine-4-phosphate dehydrogenase
MGDPAGIGPELCLKLMSTPAVLDRCIPLVFGNAGVLRRVSRKLGLTGPRFVIPPCDAASFDGASAVVEFANPMLDAVQPGIVTEHSGRAAHRYIDAAIDSALAKEVRGIVTGPIHKGAFRMAGIPHAGHTEFLAEKTKSETTCMMLTSEEITCSLVTAHVGFNEISSLLNERRIVDVIDLSDAALRRLRGRQPRLLVCGLNPHAGEQGLFGLGEEESIIVPAIERAQRKGIQIEGPLPPDTAFLPKYRTCTDGYICMYHDQGLIPLKALAFDTAVNVTLGLPIVRTSVDHGTALDIAWQGKAQVTSFIKAVELAVLLGTDSTVRA